MKNQYPDTWQSFSEWIVGFRKKHEGYFPSNLEKWFNRVESSHNDLRKRIGGIRKQVFYKLSSAQNPISKKDAEPYVRDIMEIVPQYLNGYGFTEDVFLLPTIQQGTHSVFKTGKHIRTYASSHVRDQRVAGDSKPKLARLDKALSELGNLWAKARTSESELEATLSTSAKSFVLLGHYGPDSDSCFRNGSDKTNHKFVLGQTPNTFAFSISKRHPTKPKNINVFRAFGWIDNNVVNFVNPYLLAGFAEGDAIETMRRVSSEILNEDVDVTEDACLIAGTGEANNGIYNNPYGRWSFTTKGRKIGPQTLTPYRNFIQLFECDCCHQQMRREGDLRPVDGLMACIYCVENAQECEITHELSLKPLVDLVAENGLTYAVHPQYAAKFQKCACGMHTQLLQKINNIDMCPECVESQTSPCSRCLVQIPNGDLNDIDDEVVCDRCITSEDVLAQYLVLKD